MCGGLFSDNFTLPQIYWQVWRRNNFENWTVFGKITGKNTVSSIFMVDSVYEHESEQLTTLI